MHCPPMKYAATNKGEYCMALFTYPTETPAQRRERAEDKQLLSLPVDRILPNPFQPRKQFDDADISELKASIAQNGLIQPLIVRRVQGTYELIAGERRLRACRLLGMREIPCIVQYACDESSAMMALIENLQRRDLHFFEEAESYRQLLRLYGMTQESLAMRIGKSQSFLANKLRLLRLSPIVRRNMIDAGLSERHARALLRLRDEQLQLQLIERIQEKKLTVKETERLVDRTIDSVTPAPHPKLLRLLKDYRLFVNSVKCGAEQLRDAGLSVEIIQTDLTDGVDMLLKVRK